jgi:hypothetical protein
MPIREIFARSLKIYGSRFALFFLLALLCQIFPLAAGFRITHVTDVTVLYVFASIVGVLFRLWASIVFVNVGTRAWRGELLTVRSAIKMPSDIFFSIAWAGILYAVIVIIPHWVILSVRYLIGSHFEWWLVAARVPVSCSSIYFGLFFGLWMQTSVLEEKHGFSALVRSRDLLRLPVEARGFFKSHLGRLVLVLLPFVILRLFAVTLFLVTSHRVAGVVDALGSAFVFPLAVLALTVFYLDLKARTEQITTAS